MTADLNEEALEKALKFFAYKNVKDWAKDKKITGMEPELLNSHYKTESQGMEAIIKQQAGILLEKREYVRLKEIVSKSKGPVLKIIADLLQNPGHVDILDALLERFRIADFNGRKAILNAGDRLAGFLQLEALVSIEQSFTARKKPAKSDEDLARQVKQLVEKINHQDEILRTLKYKEPALEVVAKFSREDLHPRLKQLPLAEMLPWLQLLAQDDKRRNELRDYASTGLKPGTKVKKAKLALADLQYYSVILVVTRNENSRKLLITSLLKLDQQTQGILLPYMNEADRNEFINKLLASPTNKERALSHLENHPEWVPEFSKKLLQSFEQLTLSQKVRLGYLLLISEEIPTSAQSEFLKRLALYVELTAQAPFRTNLCLELIDIKYSRFMPALHRCRDRDKLLKDLDMKNPPRLFLIIGRALAIYSPETDDIDDLLWLLNHYYSRVKNQDSKNPAKGAILREIELHSESIYILIEARIPNRPVYYADLVRVLFDVLNASPAIIENIGTLLNESEIDGVLATQMFDIWCLQWNALSQVLVSLFQLSLSSLDFRQAYIKAVENKWEQYQDELFLQLQNYSQHYYNRCTEMLSKMAKHRKELEPRLKAGFDELLQSSNSLNIADLDFLEIYVKDCQQVVLAIFDAQEEELQSLFENNSKPKNFREFMAYMEQIIVRSHNLDVTYGQLEERVNYLLADGLALNIEKIFLLPDKGNKTDTGLEMIINRILQLLGMSSIARRYSTVIFNPAEMQSNDSINVGEEVRIVSPGIMSLDGTVIRKSLVVRM